MDKKYSVETFFSNKVIWATDDPHEAVLAWCKSAREYYADLAILGKNKEAAKELIAWANANHGYVRLYCERYRVPYKVSFIMNSITEALDNGCSGFQWGRDQIHPFSYG